MNKYLLLAGALSPIIIFWGMGQSAWHRQRNRLNVLPEGQLIKVADKVYADSTGRRWILQPQSKNQFHQPAGPVAPVTRPYEKVVRDLAFDPSTPNWKFLSPTEDGGSHEAILQPSGEYLTEGPQRGTYNYGHPEGFTGTLKHAIYDVIPHFVSASYED